MSRTRLLCAYINYCAGYLAYIAKNPASDPRIQAGDAEYHTTRIDRATQHLRGYHERNGYWQQSFRLTDHSQASIEAVCIRAIHA